MSPARDPLPPERLYALAEILVHAESTGTFVEPPSISDGLTLDDAYRIGAVIARSRIGRGWRCRGWKVGFTNREIWSQWGLDQPIVGPVYAQTVVDAAAAGGGGLSLPPVRVPAGRRAALMIEVEVVFGFDGTAGAAGRVRRPDWVALAAELVDCHYRGWRLHPADAVADFGLHAGLVVGPRMGNVSAETLRALDCAAVSLSAAGERLSEGVGHAVLGGPANVLAELHGPLAERIAGYGVTGHDAPHGAESAGRADAAAIAAGATDGSQGYLVSTGTLTPLVEASIGTTYEVEADLLPSFSFALV